MSDNTTVFTSLAAAQETELVRLRRNLFYVNAQRPENFQNFAEAAVNGTAITDRQTKRDLATWGLCDIETGLIPDGIRANAAEFIERDIEKDGPGKFKLVFPPGESEPAPYEPPTIRQQLLGVLEP